MKLSEITELRPITQHPGGYLDILEALRKHSLTTVKYTKSRFAKDPANPRKDVVIADALTVSYDEIVDEIEKVVGEEAAAGFIASAIQNTLSKYQLPTPGDKRWLTPAETWFV